MLTDPMVPGFAIAALGTLGSASISAFLSAEPARGVWTGPGGMKTRPFDAAIAVLGAKMDTSDEY